MQTRLNNNFILSFLSKHLIDYPTPTNINIFWSFGSLSGICLIIQIATGIFLAMHYTPNIEFAFYSVEHIMRDVPSGWILRYMHANGASFFFLLVYIHIFRGLYFGSYMYPRQSLWISGIFLFLSMMATAFMGYVLPWGQMSFWGATVITNLFSAVPIFGSIIVEWLWGGFSVDDLLTNTYIHGIVFIRNRESFYSSLLHLKDLIQKIYMVSPQLCFSILSLIIGQTVALLSSIAWIYFLRVQIHSVGVNFLALKADTVSAISILREEIALVAQTKNTIVPKGSVLSQLHDISWSCMTLWDTTALIVTGSFCLAGIVGTVGLVTLYYFPHLGNLSYVDACGDTVSMITSLFDASKRQVFIVTSISSTPKPMNISVLVAMAKALALKAAAAVGS